MSPFGRSGHMWPISKNAVHTKGFGFAPSRALSSCSCRFADQMKSEKPLFLAAILPVMGSCSYGSLRSSACFEQIAHPGREVLVSNRRVLVSAIRAGIAGVTESLKSLQPIPRRVSSNGTYDSARRGRAGK